MSDIKPISGYNDRVELKKVLPLAAPFTLNIFPVNYCNFKCVFCAQSLGPKALQQRYNYDSKEKMEWATFQRTVEQSQRFVKPYKLLSFMGHGEPLLHRELPEMVKLAKEAGIAERIEIITNGSLLTPDLSDRLIKAGITNVRVSLEGLSQQAYQETSQVNIDFHELLANLKYFHEKGLKNNSLLFVKTIDCALKEGEEKLFYKMFDNISSRMYIEQVKPVYEGVKATEGMPKVVSDRYGQAHLLRLVCPMAFFSLAIWPNGDVAPCDAIYKPICLGNVNTGDLSQMFNGPLNTAFRVQLLNDQKNEMPGCRRCCAPDDVSPEQDELDSFKSELLKIYTQQRVLVAN